MFEARISYKSGRFHTVEANSLEFLKEKCKLFIDDPEVIDIWVVKIEGFGWLKNELIPKLL